MKLIIYDNFEQKLMSKIKQKLRAKLSKNGVKGRRTDKTDNLALYIRIVNNNESDPSCVKV